MKRRSSRPVDCMLIASIDEEFCAPRCFIYSYLFIYCPNELVRTSELYRLTQQSSDSDVAWHMALALAWHGIGMWNDGMTDTDVDVWWNNSKLVRISSTRTSK
jgi:hypothetical protein